VGAELEHRAAPLHRRLQRPALGQAEADRLLQVDVLAGPGRRQRHQHVPVIRRGDEDGVDVVAGNEVAPIGVRGATAVGVVPVGAAFGQSDAAGLGVADGQDACIVLGEEVPHDGVALVSHADAADGDPVARRDAFILAERRRRQDRRSAHGRHAGPAEQGQEPPPTSVCRLRHQPSLLPRTTCAHETVLKMTAPLGARRVSVPSAREVSLSY
jgi:hypothetical protein